ncbi:hypothetical protein CCHR01_11507 [Colletotrichum chrysophilum]|uniref:Uncharacterized protein n=1 Tax=Colletotrichum chrysophilum TaxID=1836956 RepID=A0AAD9EFP2_9PEZI|nr:hypothetical protein CCHR01_11507 [Colletotrichum chrysophilum]
MEPQVVQVMGQSETIRGQNTTSASALRTPHSAAQRRQTREGNHWVGFSRLAPMECVIMPSRPSPHTLCLFSGHFRLALPGSGLTSAAARGGRRGLLLTKSCKENVQTPSSVYQFGLWSRPPY